MQDFIVKIDGKKFVDIVEIIPKNTNTGREIVVDIKGEKVTAYTPHPGRAKGRGSKKIKLNRFIKPDDLFWEGLGLWQGEGGKDKGLYFGNSCLEVLLHFLKFVEQRIGIPRNEFMVTVNLPELIQPEDKMKKKWSTMLRIPFENFTHICVDPRINEEYAQLYLNGIILTVLMKNLHDKLKSMILKNEEPSIPYLRGLFAAEGSVLLKSWGTLSHVDFSSSNEDFIEFVRKCLLHLGIISGDYLENGRKTQIYGKDNFEKFRELKLHVLHSDKFQKFERRFKNYRRDVKSKFEMMSLILNELIKGPKTYDELAFPLKKGRSTVQSHYIPILEKEKLVKTVGKRGRALLFQITLRGKKFFQFGRV